MSDVKVSVGFVRPIQTLLGVVGIMTLSVVLLVLRALIATQALVVTTRHGCRRGPRLLLATNQWNIKPSLEERDMSEAQIIFFTGVAVGLWFAFPLGRCWEIVVAFMEGARD